MRDTVELTSSNKYVIEVSDRGNQAQAIFEEIRLKIFQN